MARHPSTSQRPLRTVRPVPADLFLGLSAVLWDERIVLDHVAYKLVQHQDVVASGRAHWLAAAEAELRRAVERVAEYEVLRAVEVDHLAQVLDAPDGLRLRDICALAGTPWDEILGDHRDALRALVDEVETQSDVNARLLGADPDTSRHAPEQVGRGVAPQLAIADANYRAALETILRVRQLSLVDFLS